MAAWPTSGTDRSSAFRETLAALIGDEAPGLLVMLAVPERRAALSERPSSNSKAPMVAMSFLEAGPQGLDRGCLKRAGRRIRREEGGPPSRSWLLRRQWRRRPGRSGLARRISNGRRSAAVAAVCWRNHRWWRNTQQRPLPVAPTRAMGLRIEQAILDTQPCSSDSHLIRSVPDLSHWM